MANAIPVSNKVDPKVAKEAVKRASLDNAPQVDYTKPEGHKVHTHDAVRKDN